MNDKQLTKQLLDIGLDWEKARIVVGLILEERQLADHQGYVRGYNDGHADAKNSLTSN